MIDFVQSDLVASNHAEECRLAVGRAFLCAILAVLWPNGGKKQCQCQILPDARDFTLILKEHVQGYEISCVLIQDMVLNTLFAIHNVILRWWT